MSEGATSIVGDFVHETFRQMVADAQAVLDKHKIPAVDLGMIFGAVTVY